MKKWTLAAITAFSITLAAPSLTQAQGGDPSYFDEGQIIVRIDPLFLLSGGIQAGAEYYVSNQISAGLEIIQWSVLGASYSGFIPYARYHFKHAKDVFPENKTLRNGNFYALGGFATVNWSGGFGVSGSDSGLVLGAGYMLVWDKKWVIDFQIALPTTSFSGYSSLGTGFGYAL